MLNKEHFGKLYKVDLFDGDCCYLKVDEEGRIGYNNDDIPPQWDSLEWGCGLHQHWKGHNFETFEVIFENNISLENK